MAVQSVDRWVGTENIAEVIVEGERTPALLDTGSQINLVTPEYASQRGFAVHPISDVASGPINLVGMGGHTERPLGYCILRLQTSDVAGYDEEMPFFVLPDDSKLGKKCPMVWGTSILRRVINVMRESELDQLSIPWATARTTHVMKGSVPTELNARMVGIAGLQSVSKAVDSLDGKVTLNQDLFLSPFQHYLVNGLIDREPVESTLNAMVLAPYREDDAKLPLGLQVLNTYVEIPAGTNQVSLCVYNSSPKYLHLSRHQIIAHIVAGDLIPSSLIRPDEEVIASPEAPPPLTVHERQDLLLEKLNLDG